MGRRLRRVRAERGVLGCCRIWFRLPGAEFRELDAGERRERLCDLG
ncbi:hypothetical protein [Nonomuraea sp. SBT364]|nr:hypothetical protein [Nonomuraea sp. SBT364]